MKYKINKEFFPYSHMVPPIRNASVAAFMNKFIRVPGGLFRDKEIAAKRIKIPGYGGDDIEIIMISPRGSEGERLPCLVYYHGGGFFFEAAGYHYRLMKEYALKIGARVALVRYRLAPKYRHPVPIEDSYLALRWVYENAERIAVDRERIAVGGDSAGGALCAAVCLMSRDRGMEMPAGQMLLYPVLDRRMITRTATEYTDTPIWNAKLSRKMWAGYLPKDGSLPALEYASPAEAQSLAGMPHTYLEVIEFDSLRDEGIEYAERLKRDGVSVELFEVKGAMHGFDFVEKAPTSRASVLRRCEFLKRIFHVEEADKQVDRQDTGWNAKI